MQKKRNLILLFSLIFIINTFLISISLKRARKISLYRSVIADLHLNDENFQVSASGNAPEYRAIDHTILSDPRMATLQQFFKKYNSVLYGHTATILDASDRYQLDYRLLPAIAMQESGLCKKIPVDSHNCWGWGITGGKVRRFASYDEAIYAIAEGIRTEYVDKRNLTTVAQIMRVYTPADDGNWAAMINGIMTTLE